VEKCDEAQAAYGGPARDPFTGAPYRQAESCDVTVFISKFLIFFLSDISYSLQIFAKNF
jgi:hypothetical protein